MDITLYYHGGDEYEEIDNIPVYWLTNSKVMANDYALSKDNPMVYKVYVDDDKLSNRNCVAHYDKRFNNAYCLGLYDTSVIIKIEKMSDEEMSEIETIFENKKYKNMKKQTIKLNERQLREMIKKSVSYILKEEFSYTCNDYRDWGTTSELKNYHGIEELHEKLYRLLNSQKPDSEFLHLAEWYKLINQLKDEPKKLRFYTLNDENNEHPEKDVIIKFEKDTSKLPYPNLYVSANTSFGEKVTEIKQILRDAYNIYDNFINYFISKHDNGEMKQNDLDADWKKNDEEYNDFLVKSKKDAEYGADMRKYGNAFSRNNKRGALDRYDIVADPEGKYSDGTSHKDMHKFLTNNI